MDLPVTLVIKAPNQRVDDHLVECMMDWTVKKLKQHLTDVYPSKPQETQQKLIYSGKLLADHLTLKEILRAFDDGCNKHTVHLVCASQLEAPYMAQTTQSHSRQESGSSSSSSSSTSVPETEGIRYRGPTPASAQSPESVPVSSGPMFNPYSAPLPAGFTPEAAMMYGGMGPASGLGGYSPEQYVWMQQMYQQYMAQYMQYYQQAGYVVPPSTPTQTPDGTQPQAQAENQARDPAAPAAGAVLDDDPDEEFGQRDWLDYLYMFSRSMVLLGIVYFYSSLTRFLMVSTFFMIVYAYQMHWFGIFGPRRRQQPQQQRQQQQEQQQQQQEQPPQPDQQQQNSNEQPPTGDTQSADTQTETQTETVTPPPPVVPAGPGTLQVAWTFVSTFFTSLMPAPPAPVNAN